MAEAAAEITAAAAEAAPVSALASAAVADTPAASE